MTVELPMPLVSPQGFDDVERYDEIDNILPLLKDSEVFIKVRQRAKKYCFVQETFKAKYLEGTRLLEMPKEIAININCDFTSNDPMYDGPVYIPQWAKNRVLAKPINSK